jgi:tRNA threonylcarbamoyladenosine biosynthesis protein TsaB
MREGKLLLGIDTCGPAGSVALARLAGAQVEILGERALAGKSYSATLVKAVEELLVEAGVPAAVLMAVVVTSGPGSFTGVRVGLSAAKGLAEATGLPVAAASRLAVLAAKAGTGSAALDAHRSEVFLRLASAGGETRELLTGAPELAALDLTGGPVAVCDAAAAELLKKLCAGVELRLVEAPTAADVLRFAAERVAAGEFDDVERLDGHYLRRSDAEIFWRTGPGGFGRMNADGAVQVRRMMAADLDDVLSMATNLARAPQWPRAAYEAELNEGKSPRRMALVAEIDKKTVGFAVAMVLGPQADLETIAVLQQLQRRGVATALWTALATELGRAGVRETLLEVRASNREALGFYGRLGFEETGRRKGYYADPVEDAVLMRMVLE